VNDVYSIYYDVSLSGKKLDKKRKECIESISIEEQSDGSNTCSLVVNDPEFLYIVDDIFIEDIPIYVEFGWWNDTHRDTFSGYISAIDIDFPDTGFPVLLIYCLDETHKMNRKKKKRTWDNATNAEVVVKIAQEYGYKSVIQSGYLFKRETTITQSNQTDIDFIESLAKSERDPFICKLIGDTIYYVKKGLLKAPSATVYYKQYPYDVVSLRFRINKEIKQEEVASADINTDNKTVDSATATNSNTSRDTQGNPVKSYNPVSGSWSTLTD
jgi:phage protein D